MSTLLTLAAKDLRLMLRDRFALFWIFAFPLMFALFFGSIFSSSSGGGGRGRLSLAVVDEDGSEVSAELLTHLADKEGLWLERTGEAADAPLRTSTLDEAREAVQKGRRSAYLRIPAGFGDNPWAVFGAGGDDRPALEIGIDPGRSAEAGFLQGMLMEAVMGSLRDRMLDRDRVHADLEQARREVAAAGDVSATQKLVLQTFFGALDSFIGQVDFDDLDLAGADGDAADGDAGGLGQPFTVVDVSRDRQGEPRSSFDITFPQALVWGLMSVAMTFAITLVRERSAGTLLRLRIAPITRWQVLGGKALGCFCACLLVMGLLFLFGRLALGVRIDRPGLLLVAMLATAACFTGIMMTISVLGRTENAVAGASWGLMMPFAMVGGGMIPLIAMPSWLVTASDFSFFKWSITALEGAVWRGFGPADMALPCAVLVAVGAVFFTVGVLIFRRVEA